MQPTNNESDRMMKEFEEIKEKKKKMQELQEKIKKLDEVKVFKRIEQEELAWKNKIRKLSTYEITKIGNIIARLMEHFEQIPYHYVESTYIFSGYTHYVEPENNQYLIDNIYPSYKLKETDTVGYPYNSKDKTKLCLLLPSNYLSDFEPKNRNMTGYNESYIQVFIDYLYEKRYNESLYEISDERLDKFLQEFLEISKDLQLQRREEINRQLEKRLEHEKRKEYEKSCLIDRKLIFNTLAYIINHYEVNMMAVQEKEEEWVRSSRWSELYCYHKLTIKHNGTTAFYKTKVDSNGVYPDEEYCGVYVDINKNTNICFFDIKQALLPVINNSEYAMNFMNNLEEMYEQKRNITIEDIHSLLVDRSNERKDKQRILRVTK